MFEIRTKGKASLDNLSVTDSSVSEALNTIYTHDYDFMIFINWNGFKIPMDGVSFSQIYNDVIIMLEELEEEYDFSVNFLDTGLTAVWSFTIEGDFLKVEAKWVDIASYGYENTTVEELEKVSNIVVINKNKFINEWDNLLRIVKDDLLNTGYNGDLVGFEYLKRLA
ncbi:hypothetical protein H5J24_09250 [Chryseobacterium capnotolerans]|uniref:hypothetical protein n=1 Tax=Chryseobacterium TaxID=59732 RepID=UPI00083AAF09|nr:MULTISPECIES: hypothetical protein [Chryseobacterium]UHO40157.1 hypothetical protein H5J24_09250 [Chryseobacterium capnotolerans]